MCSYFYNIIFKNESSKLKKQTQIKTLSKMFKKCEILFLPSVIFTR